MGDIDKSPRSCDLTALYFFIYDCLKQNIYVNKAVTISDLKLNIEFHLCGNIIANSVKSMVTCQSCLGWHLPTLYFRTNC